MNILVLADIVPYPPNTGIKIRTYNTIKQLAMEGENTVVLLCFNHRILIRDEEEMARCVTSLQVLCKEVVVFPIPSDRNAITRYVCVLKNIFQTVPYRASRYHSKKCIATLERVLADGAIDLIHLDKSEFFRYARWFKGIPFVCTNHNVESMLFAQRARYETTLGRRIFAYVQYLKTRRYERKALNAAAGYITCTEDDAAFFREKMGITTRQATIANGVDAAYYSPVAQESDNYVLLIGAQSKEATANYDATRYFMEEIWLKVKQRCPELRLKIVGRDPDEWVRHLGSTYSGVDVLGFVDDEREVMGRASALLVPLRVGGGSRVKIVTAMAMGVAVVSTSVGAAGIAWKDGENILIGDDAGTFAAQVARVVEDKELRRRIGAGGRMLVEAHYDWSGIGVRLRAFYREILKSV